MGNYWLRLKESEIRWDFDEWFNEVCEIAKKFEAGHLQDGILKSGILYRIEFIEWVANGTCRECFYAPWSPINAVASFNWDYFVGRNYNE